MGCLGNCSQAVMGSSPGEQLPWRPEEHNHLGNSPVCPATPIQGCIWRRCTWAPLSTWASSLDEKGGEALVPTPPRGEPWLPAPTQPPA